ncbi:MAG TPA: DUF1501 domain-containing protein [Steroidobacteraceae bacterium]|nr:DUF1501 domain-containing protein [Steroidobacteraceae bacterium]
MTHMTRRRFLGHGLAGAGALAAGALAGGGLWTTRLAFGAPASAGDGRVVFIILRGALDGLSAVPPYGDPAYAALRGPLAVPPPGSKDGGLQLDHLFALHPSLAFMHECFAGGELAVLHAAATPYRERSHFDGQDVLESGMVRPHASESGWLNRALALRDTRPARLGIALGANVPLVMRGPADVASWAPSKLASLSEDTLQRVADLYASDPLLAQRLADALASDAIAAEAQSQAASPADAMMPAMAGDQAASGAPAAAGAQRGGAARYLETVRALAGFLRRDDGPRVAVMETSGWDTHANEGGAQGQLATRLAALDAGLREMRTALGPAWSRTAVLLATEFGRTAASNGTRGTDHGTGSAAWLLGGAVAGGRVLADWPGLGAGSLYEGRDLRPTLDLRSAMKEVLHVQLELSDRELDTAVFPDSAAAPRLQGLLRA